MKLVIVGNEEECLGFSLAGVEGIAVGNDAEFGEQMRRLLQAEGVGVIAVTDRFFSAFSRQFGAEHAARAVPAVVFIPSVDGTHRTASLKEYLANILGIRL